jgi:CDP-diacylglycerol--serine O-phosphatidyltransferase
MFAFKFKSFGWAGNEIRYVFIIVSLLLLGVLKFAALSAIIVLYILTSVILFFYQKTKSISEK